MIIKERFLFVLALCSVLFAISCSKAPKQYVVDVPSNPKQEQKNLKAAFDDETPVEGTDLPAALPEEDEIARENSKKDIIYGVGAAGITFNTTLVETTIDGAETRLSKPRTVTDDNYWLYDEGMILYWRTQPPRTTLMFWMTKDYQGKMRVGGEIGDLEMGRDLSAFFSADDQEGRGFIVKLYNQLEKMGDDFNCLESNICQIKAFESHYLFLWSKFGMLVSKDRHLIGDIRLFDQSEQGPLANNMDLAYGKISFGPDAGVYLGQSWQSAKDMIGFEGKSSTGKSSFSFDYGGIYLGTTKSHYEREYIQADPTETLNTLYFGNGYNNFFTLEQNYILFDRLGDNFVFSLAPEVLSEKADVLRLKVGVMENQENFVTELIDFLSNHLEESSAGAQTVSRVTGLNNTAFEREYTGSILQYDATAKTGRYVAIDFSNTVGNLTSLEVTSLDDPINQVLVPGYLAGVDLPAYGSQDYSDRAKLTSLAGFSIGQELELRDFDYGREEVTVVVSDQLQTRAYYSKHSLLSGIFGNDGKVIVKSVSTVYVGDLLSALQVVEVPSEDGRHLVKIVGIITANLYKGIKGLCGLSDLNVQMGISDKEILSRIDAAEREQKKRNKDFSCMRFKRKQGDGSNRLGALYFPENRIKLTFIEQELSEIAIYARPSEVE